VDQIRRAYQLLYGREPNAAELRLGSEFLTSQPLPLYTRALFNANEFVYVP
jgi:hypothetical protein